MENCTGIRYYLIHGIVLASIFNYPAFAQLSGAESDVIESTFRGKIVYDGSYEGKVSTSPRIPRNLSLGSILDAATSAKSERYKGGAHYEIEYDGNQVKGTWQQQGTYTANGSLTGTRNGSTCQLVTNEGIRFTAECGKTRFFSRLSFSDNRGQKYQSVLDANRTAVVDYVERDKQSAIAAEQARVAAAAAAARYAALPSAGPALTRKFDALVQTDSQGWAFNRYDAGSMSNVKIVSGKAGVGTYVMRGEYTFNGGSQGSVMAEMVGSKLSCIQFWDGVVGCRGLRTPEQGQAMRNALVGAIVSSGSGSSSSSNCNSACEDERFSNWTQENVRQGLNENGTPK